MRLFTKYFLFGMLLLGLAFSASGYFLLRYSMESSLAREADFALRQYQYNKFTVQSAILSYFEPITGWVTEDSGAYGISGVFTEEGDVVQGEDDSLARQETLPEAGEAGDAYQGEGAVGQDAKSREAENVFLKSLFSALAAEIDVPVAFYSEDKTLLYSEIEGLDPGFLDELSESAHVYRFWKDRGSVLVGSVVNCESLEATYETWLISKERSEAGDDGEDEWDRYVIVDGRPDALAQAGEADEEIIFSADTMKIKVQEADLSADSEDTAGLGRVYFVNQWDISKTVKQQSTLRQYFIRCYLIAMTAGMVLLGVLSALLTGPLKRMSKAARRMAEGYYEERLTVRGRDEIGELAGSFNQMAAAVEEKIGELSRAAREKEDFVANFAHELKTPLTSIIGYADTIYQKELPREEVRKASWHIWNEGMRLESLSFKLMEMTVLGRQEFPLVEMPVLELLQDAAQGLDPVFVEAGIDFALRAEEAYIYVDYDLFKTLLVNLVDNSVKAGARRIELQGQVREEAYEIRVSDNGCGMEEEVLSRITEAFYMVDKARSRKQHGAGLGLALAERIAAIHGGRLAFDSKKGEGTTVSFSLKCGKGGTMDGDDENGCGC